MRQDQLWEALTLGKEIQASVGAHLEKGGQEEIDLAVKKIQFTYGIAKLGNEDLIEPHAAASKAVQNYAENITINIDPQLGAPSIEDQIVEFKKYQFLKKQFDPYVSFEKSDKALTAIIKKTKDTRVVAWNEPHATILGVVSTVALGIAGFAFPPLWVGAAAAGASTAYAVSHLSNPSQEEVDLTEFFKGP
jgi:hypothetical protein